jgi:LysR family transcriptional regulator (chromosome initiation inhibitor)
VIDYASLAAVAAVVHTGSFESAALQLGVTPSAVSQRVKGLEERVGVPLVVRAAPCIATAAGARLCAHFDQVALLEHDLLADAPWAATFGGQTPTLKVAVNADSLATWFPAAAARFTASNAAALNLVLDDENRTADRLRAGEVLAAVTTTGKPVQGCRTVSLGALRYVATATPAYVRRYFGGGVSAEALAAAPVIRFEPGDLLQNQWTMQAIGAAVEAPTHWVPSTRGFLDFTLQGVGWSLTPQGLAAPFLASGELVDLDQRIRVDVPLFWQHVRLTAHLIGDLTSAVRAVGGAYLVQG